MHHRLIQQLRRSLEEILGEAVDRGDIKESTEADLSSTIAFRLSKKLGKTPREIAEEISSEITLPQTFERVDAVNGYLNFFFNHPVIFPHVMADIRERKDSYGRGEKKKDKIILEHTSINPSGPIHVGRLRNSLIGDAVYRILSFYGYEVETHYYVNDIGKQIAIIAQGMEEGIKPDEKVVDMHREYVQKPDFQVFFQYVAANRIFEEDTQFADRVQELIRKAEGGDEDSLKKITAVAVKCLSGQKVIFQKLDINFNYFDFESQHIRSSDIREVIDFLRETVYWRETEGGCGLDLSVFGLKRREGISILQRRDGTSVYLTRDIAYHLKKVNLGDIIINVLGEDHKFEFRQLEAILREIYKIEKPLEAVHYSFVNFEGAELSTRKGQIIPVDKLIDEAIGKAAVEIEKRKTAGREAAPDIGIGAIKYHILKTAPSKPINFNWSQALNFEGEASPYIQYAFARCCSVLRKADINIDVIDIGRVDTRLEEEEKDLLMQLMRFPDVVAKSAVGRRPDTVAHYLFELASGFSRFYKKCRVLQAEGGVKERRLLLVDSTRQVLGNGLGLLGIRAPERM